MARPSVRRPRPNIYLISVEGAIWTSDESAAVSAELVGFRRVSKAIYRKQINKIRRIADNYRAAAAAHAGAAAAAGGTNASK